MMNDGSMAAPSSPISLSVQTGSEIASAASNVPSAWSTRAAPAFSRISPRLPGSGTMAVMPLNGLPAGFGITVSVNPDGTAAAAGETPATSPITNDDAMMLPTARTRRMQMLPQSNPLGPP